MAIVRFLEYRQYEESRVEVNNSMMALLAGAGIASHFLQLTDGSERLLPEIFPRVPHIGRFNLSSSSARGILDSAESHLAAMSIPYVLAVHEDYLKTCIKLLERAGVSNAGTANGAKLYNAHGIIERDTGGSFSPLSIHQINSIRLMRNCLVHAGSRVGPELVNHLSSTTPAIEAAWLKVAGRSPSRLQRGDVVGFGFGEVLIALAATKVLAREANEMLQLKLNSETWADLLTEDAAATVPQNLKGPLALDKLRGKARFDYAAAGLTDTNISDALTRWRTANP
ncbi:hypothetical protein [Streptomyces sp. SLBN-115]|uniref:hypothetical protein n=1 Tax=Streptomyces sp. SLBN-115 TaxID=2768453 RepID=UPI00114F3E42|nr:hypothetical protein [Streptomyces sp. SLBN-115]TQJ54654.1 hypothetical protein FBY34_2437 [Streptomyces sp. SLBN-115]